MKTKALPVKIRKAFPLEKRDIQYDPSSEDLSIKREKFDAFVKYVQGLEQSLEAAEDARDVAKYRARKAGKTADVLQALTEDVVKGTAAVRDWLASSGHTLQELSERTGIPYATCHRIVNERLGTPNLEIGYLQKMISGVSRDQKPFTAGAEGYPRFKRVLLGLPEGLAEDELVSSWETKGSEVATVHAGLDIVQKVRELHPDLILLDVSMPNLEKSGLERLRDFAKDKKTTIILTGEIAEANSALLQCSFESKNQAQELAPKAELAEDSL
jgi:CheY-like chemotaxis protein